MSVRTKKEGESEELTHLTEGSFEDTIIVVRFDCDFNSSNKKTSIWILTLIVLLQLLVQV